MRERVEWAVRPARVGVHPMARRVAALGVVGLVVAAMTVVLGAGARAQERSDGFATDLNRMGQVLGRDILGVQTSDLLGHLRLGASLTFSYADDPLTMVDADDRDLVLARFIDHRVGADVGVALGLFDRLELGVTLPLTLSQSGDDLAALGRPGETVSAFALGDLGARLALRVFGGRSGFQLHLAGRVAIPTGDADAYMSDGAVRIEPSLGFGYAADGFRVAFELGYELRPERTAATFVGDDMVRWGVAGRVPVWTAPGHGLAVLLAMVGSVQTAKGIDPMDPSLELDDDPSLSIEAQGALEWVTGPVALMAGGSWSAVRAVGSPDVRAFLGLGWVSAPSKDKDGDGLEDEVDRCPDDEEDLDGFEDEDGCPDLDDDGDGIPDEDDKCPKVAGIKAERGCPSRVRDSDGDGIDDAADQCPNEAEDKDGFQDADGCPDPDNDGDGVPDTADKCPNDAEDKDGFDDEDGCPDPDNDGDGIPDASDQCPDRPEVKNGLDDTDGCPDTTQRDLALTDTRIEILKPIQFLVDKVRPESGPVLDQLAQMLNEHRYLTRVRVESHTDSEGDAQYNLALTQRRAEAVVSYLVKKGVAPERLVAQGFGEERPLMPNDRPDRRAKNRRVEIHLLTIDGKPVSPAPR